MSEFKGNNIQSVQPQKNADAVEYSQSNHYYAKIRPGPVRDVDITIDSIKRLCGKLAVSLGNDFNEILVTEKQFKNFALRIEQLIANQNQSTNQPSIEFPKNDLRRANELAGRISEILNSIADRVAQGKNDNNNLFSTAEGNLDTLANILTRLLRISVKSHSKTEHAAQRDGKKYWWNNCTSSVRHGPFCPQLSLRIA